MSDRYLRGKLMKRLIAVAMIVCFSTTMLYANQYYKDAITYYDMVMYDEALVSLDDAINRGKSDDKMLIDINMMRGKIYFVLGKKDQAKNAYLVVLRKNVDFQMSEDESPKIRTFFKKIKDLYQQSLTVKLAKPEIMFQVKKKVAYKKRVILNAVISNMNEAREAKIFYRVLGHTTYQKSELLPITGHNFEGYIPLPLDMASKNFMIEYYIGTVDFQGRSLARFPDSGIPIMLSVTGINTQEKSVDSSDGSITSKWWFWTILTTVVLSTAGVIIVISNQGTPQKSGGLKFDF